MRERRDNHDKEEMKEKGTRMKRKEKWKRMKFGKTLVLNLNKCAFNVHKTKCFNTENLQLLFTTATF